ncbi:unnamed protein product [Closterium sp. NIES-65]|nr:unnamed protein product [Closterium sp. NIES-65]
MGRDRRQRDGKGDCRGNGTGEESAMAWEGKGETRPLRGPAQPLDGPASAPLRPLNGPFTTPSPPAAPSPTAAPSPPAAPPTLAAPSPTSAPSPPAAPPTLAAPSPTSTPSPPAAPPTLAAPSPTSAPPPPKAPPPPAASPTPAAPPPSARSAEQPNRRPDEPPSSRAAQQPRCPTVDFEVWVDDLQLFLQCDRADGLSLFDLTSGASPAPAADADATLRSQWATRDAAARLAVCRHLLTTERAHFSQYKSAQTLYDVVVARYSSPATSALSRLMLPYLFPDLVAFPTVADLITHLRTSDTRYRAAHPAEDHFLSVCPTTLTVDLLEKALLAIEKSIVAVGASRGDPRTPVFEGCSPSPLLPSVASSVAADLVGFESVSATLPRARNAAPARARGARALEGVEGAVEVVVEAVEGVGVVVGVVPGLAAAATAVEEAEAVEVAEGAEEAEVVEEAEVEETAEAAEVAAAAEAAVVEGVATLRKGLAPVVRGGGFGPCSYVLRTGDRAGEQCGGPHSTQRYFGRLTDAWRRQFPEASEIPRWGDLAKAGVAIFDLDFHAILAAMYAVDTSLEGACYLCVPPDPGIKAAALGAGETTALGASASAAPDASASAAPGAGESALSGTT